jgi:hypothetical protein
MPTTRRCRRSPSPSATRSCGRPSREATPLRTTVESRWGRGEMCDCPDHTTPHPPPL